MKEKKSLWATIWESMTKTGGCCGGGSGCCGTSDKEDAEAVEKKDARESEN